MKEGGLGRLPFTEAEIGIDEISATFFIYLFLVVKEVDAAELVHHLVLRWEFLILASFFGSQV